MHSREDTFLSDFSTGTIPSVTSVCLKHTASATINSNDRLFLHINTDTANPTTVLCGEKTTPFY